MDDEIIIPECSPIYAPIAKMVQELAAKDARIAELERRNRGLIESAQEGHETPCVNGPLCPYCEIEKQSAKIAELEQSAREREAEIEANFPFVDKLRSTLYQIGQIADLDSCSPKMCEISELVDDALTGTVELALGERDAD